MDALGHFLQLYGLAGSGKTHPITKPEFTLAYEQKDITGEVSPYLISLVYTDYLGDQSDELAVEFEDVDGRWIRGWYPEQGDALSLGLGDQFTGLVALGNFEIAEIEYRHPPSVVAIKALSTGITKANRTLRPKSYEKTTLAKIVRIVAARLKLSVTGKVRDIPIERITQYQERDVEFLTRLARQYGHTFKIVDKTLVFTDNIALAEQEPVTDIIPEDIIDIKLRDLIKGVPQEAVVTGYDAKAKKTISTKRKTKPLRPKAKKSATSDTLIIIPNKGESQAQIDARADAALHDAQSEQCAGTITVVGNAKLVAGQVVALKQFGKFSGRYLVKQARHDYQRSSGYSTELEIKMVQYIAEGDDAANP